MNIFHFSPVQPACFVYVAFAAGNDNFHSVCVPVFFLLISIRISRVSSLSQACVVSVAFLLCLLFSAQVNSLHSENLWIALCE